MIGGDQGTYDKAKDVIDCSKKMKLLGQADSGQLAKMTNQICIAVWIKAFRKQLILV